MNRGDPWRSGVLGHGLDSIKAVTTSHGGGAVLYADVDSAV
jgi:hypothetical protein